MRNQVELGVPIFEENVGYFPTMESGKANIEVYLRIPLSKLQFIKTSQGYLARFEILLAIYRDKNLIRKTDRADSFFVETYYETHTSEAASPPSFEIENIPSGNYELRIILKDLESKSEYTRESDIVVPDFQIDSEIVFGSIIPIANGKYSQADVYPSRDSFHYEFKISLPDSITGYLVRGIESEKGIFDDTVVLDKAGSHRISGSIEIPEDIYEFIFFAEFLSDGKRIAETEKEVSLARNAHYYASSDMESLIDQLDLIGTHKEIREMRKALENESRELDNLIAAFWEDRDPTPGTEINEIKEEFYARVEEANRRYGGMTPGWRTDMGKVFIVYGEPDEIERHPFDPGYFAYQIWYYYSPRRTFYFEDRLGDGTYDLVYQQ